MGLTIILIVAVILSIIFHYIGVYAGAKKIVWVVIALLWAGSINIAMSEIKQKGYKEIQKMIGKHKSTDKIIEESKPKVSVYEMIKIKNSFQINEKSK